MVQPDDVRLRLVLIVALLMFGQVRLEQNRWWRSPQAVARLGLSAEQTGTIERAYAQAAADEASSSLDVIRFTNELCVAIDGDADDDTLLNLTQRIAAAQSREASTARRFGVALNAALATRQLPTVPPNASTAAEPRQSR